MQDSMRRAGGGGAERLWLLLLLGLALRVALLWLGLGQVLRERPEIATPVTGVKRLLEGHFLYRHGVDPYDGSTLHESPLLLLWKDLQSRLLPAHLHPLLHILADLIIALELVAIAKRWKTYALGAKLLENEDNLAPEDWFVAAVHLFNPYNVATTLGLSSIIWTHLAIASGIFCASRGQRLLCCLCVAIATNLSLYPLLLAPPLILLSDLFQDKISSLFFFSRDLTVTTLLACGLFYLGVSVVGSSLQDVLIETWLFILRVEDLTPNIGLFWYLLTEMFDHFRPFFALVLQIHVFIYAPLFNIKLRDRPMTVILLTSGVIAGFKSYPTIGDMAFYISLMTLSPELVPWLRHPFLTVAIFVYTAVLLPVFHHLWLYSNAGNANFFYAITLVQALGMGLSICDLLYAALRREFELELPPSLRGQKVIQR